MNANIAKTKNTHRDISSLPFKEARLPSRIFRADGDLAISLFNPSPPSADVGFGF